MCSRLKIASYIMLNGNLVNGLKKTKNGAYFVTDGRLQFKKCTYKVQ